MQNFFKNRWIVLFLFTCICLLVAFFGKIFTDFGVHDWYKTLHKPSWTPPNWLFGPVWTVLYLTMALALWLVWDKQQKEASARTLPYRVFALQLFLNFLWSFLFFTLKNPLLALCELSLLILAVFANIRIFYSISKLAGLLLIPYLLWLCYAWSLNFEIWRMN